MVTMMCVLSSGTLLEFLNAESTVSIEIQCFKNNYGDMTVDVGTVKEWVRHVNDGGCGLQDMPRSGCPHTAAMVENERVDQLEQ
jgi:hypothetical protein